MFRHILSFVSAPAYLGGIACLAALLSPSQKGACVAFSRGKRRSFAGRILRRSGALCASASFLFLPAASLPAYVESKVAVVYWFVCFAAACVTLAFLAASSEARERLLPLGVPVFLAFVYAVCARYAYQRGFPGDMWNMESFVAMPLIGSSGLAQHVGMLCLAGAAVFHCAFALSIGKDAPFLQTCLRLAAAQFIITLFFPMLPSQVFSLSPVVAVVADYFLYWGLIALLSPGFSLLERPVLYRVSPFLAGTGAGLCLA